MELHLSSVNRVADIVDKLELESCDLRRGMRGVISLCDAAGTAGTGVSHIPTALVQGGVDWHLRGDVFHRCLWVVLTWACIKSGVQYCVPIIIFHI